MNGLEPLTPINWPQDALNVPDGHSGMPPVNRGNALIGSEYVCLSSRQVFNAGTAAFTLRNDILNVGQDGDFWCDSIGVVSWLTDTTTIPLPDQQRQAFLASMLSVRDVRTGRDLFFNRGLSSGGFANRIPQNSVPINLFRKLPQSGTEAGQDYAGNTPPPNGFRVTGNLPQPFCFTRQGGIALALTTLIAVPAGWTFDVAIGFSGWKEYAHASR